MSILRSNRHTLLQGKAGLRVDFYWYYQAYLYLILSLLEEKETALNFSVIMRRLLC
jgi:hypothetical protein